MAGGYRWAGQMPGAFLGLGRAWKGRRGSWGQTQECMPRGAGRGPGSPGRGQEGAERMGLSHAAPPARSPSRAPRRRGRSPLPRRGRGAQEGLGFSGLRVRAAAGRPREHHPRPARSEVRRPRTFCFHPKFRGAFKEAGGEARGGASTDRPEGASARTADREVRSRHGLAQVSRRAVAVSGTPEMRLGSRGRRRGCGRNATH